MYQVASTRSQYLFFHQTPIERPETDQLMLLPFVSGHLDTKPVEKLLLQYKQLVYKNINMQQDMSQFWEVIRKLGDGTLGKVCKVQHRETKRLAVAKIWPVENEENFSDYTADIDILLEFQHENIVNLIYKPYYLNKKLSVNCRGSCERTS